MKTNRLVAIIVASLCVFMTMSTRAQNSAPAQAAMKMPLWPTGKMPGQGAKEPEKELPSRGDGVTRIPNVSEPAVTVFKAPGTNKPTPAVIICPGGAYNILAYDKEGTEIAAWLNSIGIAGIVLK